VTDTDDGDDQFVFFDLENDAVLLDTKAEFSFVFSLQGFDVVFEKLRIVGEDQEFFLDPFLSGSIEFG